MSPRESVAIFLIGIAGVALIIADHRMQADRLISSLTSIPKAIAKAGFGARLNVAGTTNFAIPDASAGASGYLKLATPYYTGGQSAFNTIWNSASG